MCRRCFVPPYVLRAIAENGDAHQRGAALRTLALDVEIRGERAAAIHRAMLAPAAPHPLKRSIRDARGREDGRVVRLEGAPATGDPAVDEAYDGLGTTHAFFLESYGRDSIDGAGLPLIGVVHYGEAYGNAFWDGARMVFGDGDGEILGRMTASLDVIGHELAHGVTETTAGLVYSGQPGALNESVSDVFGALVLQRARGQAARAADWLIGREVWTPRIAGDALRSMRAPGTAYDDPLVGKDPQPGHMDDFVVTTQDEGGVHVNSGIPNRAFYEAAVAIGGNAWERAGRVWYETLSEVTPTSDFAAFAAATERVALRLFGASSVEARAVRAGWETVGVL